MVARRRQRGRRRRDERRRLSPNRRRRQGREGQARGEIEKEEKEGVACPPAAAVDFKLVVGLARLVPADLDTEL